MSSHIHSALHPATSILHQCLAGYTRSHPATFRTAWLLFKQTKRHASSALLQQWDSHFFSSQKSDAEGKALTILFWGHHREKGAHMHNMPKPDNYAIVHTQLPNLNALYTQMCPIFICCCTRVHKCLNPICHWTCTHTDAYKSAN